MSRFKTKGKICTLFDYEEAAEISDEEQHPNETEPNFDPYPSYTDEVYDEEDDFLDYADPYADINSNSWHKFKAPKLVSFVVCAFNCVLLSCNWIFQLKLQVFKTTLKRNWSPGRL